MKQKIKGRWEIVSETMEYYSDEVLVESHERSEYEYITSTDTKFHFTWTRIDKNFPRCIMAYDANECKEITTFELKR